MRAARTIVATTLAVLAPSTALAGAQQPDTPAPPPPLAFRTATLHRGAHAIDVELIAVARTSVRVTVSRGGRRLGRGIDHLDRGSTFVRVPIGPKGLKKLRKGLHVDVAIEYGAPDPVRAHPALLLAPPGADEDPPGALTA